MFNLVGGVYWIGYQQSPRDPRYQILLTKTPCIFKNLYPHYAVWNSSSKPDLGIKVSIQYATIFTKTFNHCYGLSLLKLRQDSKSVRLDCFDSIRDFILKKTESSEKKVSRLHVLSVKNYKYFADIDFAHLQPAQQS